MKNLSASKLVVGASFTKYAQIQTGPYFTSYTNIECSI